MFGKLAKIPRIVRWHDVPAQVAHVSRSSRLPATPWLSRQLPPGTAIFTAGADYG
jgi:hypothetical protein